MTEADKLGNEILQIDFPAVPDHLVQTNTTIVFLIAVDFPVSLSPGERRFIARHEDAPWIEFTSGKSFVGINVWKVPDVIDRQLRMDTNGFCLARALIEHTNPIAYPKLGDEFTNTPIIDGTIFELATPIYIPNQEASRDLISDAFDRCLEELNGVLIAYLHATNDLRTRTLSRQNCRPLIPMMFQDQSGKYYGLSPFGARLPLFSPQNDATLNDEELWKFEVIRTRRSRNDPFSLYVERIKAAQRYLNIDGDYSSSIVTAQTSCEILLNSILLIISWEEGLSRRETRGWFEERVTFRARVQRRLQPLLGGNWSNPPGDGLVSLLENMQHLRNSIVHLGSSPNERQARSVIEAVNTIELFAKRRLVAKRREFPRTALMLLGEPGMRKLGGWDGWMKEWFDAHAPSEPDWILAFIDWRDSQD